MGFLDNIALSSTSAFIGLALLAIGGFMILAGVGIISIQQVTVRQGRATWMLGVVFAAVGLYFFYPELMGSRVSPEGTLAEPQAEAPAAGSNDEPVNPIEDWATVNFRLPEDGAWSETSPGRFTAVGTQDTFAWSEEEYGGDFELALEIESPAIDGEANIILFGDGRGFSQGALIFTVANDFQQIVSGTIYDEGARQYVGMKPVTFEGQAHSVRITIVEGKASLYLDGSLIAAVILREETNTSGKIGLLKYWERPQVQFSNIRIRSITPGN